MAVDLTHSEHTDKLAKGRSVRAHFLPSSSSECLVGSGQYYVFVKAKDGATPVVSFELDLLELSHGCSQSFASLAFTLLFSLLVITCGLSCCFVVSRCCAHSASVGHQRARGSNRAPNPNRQRSSWFGSRDAAVADAADRRQHGELTRAPSRIVSGWSGIGQREVQIAETSVEPNFGSHQDFIPTTVAVQDSQFSTVQDATVVDIPEVEAEPGSWSCGCLFGFSGWWEYKLDLTESSSASRCYAGGYGSSRQKEKLTMITRSLSTAQPPLSFLAPSIGSQRRIPLLYMTTGRAAPRRRT